MKVVIAGKVKKRKRRGTCFALTVNDSVSPSLQELRREVMEVSAKLEATTKGVVGEKVLQCYMLPGQYESLVSGKQLSAPPSSAAEGSVMMVWLTNGIITQTGQEPEDGDPYAALAAEVTTQIVQGEGTCQESAIDPSGVHFLPPRVRAQLYR